jgi:UDP-N-acetylmuramate dehydrogenase
MSVFAAYMALSGGYDATFETDVSLAKLTGLGVGGTCALVATVHAYPALVRTLEVLAREQVPWVVLGKGTNVLAADEGYPGCVIVLGREFSRIAVGDDATVTAGAAAPLGKVVNACYTAGLAGLEFLSGIPGTVGGAVVGNAGSRHTWLGPRVVSVVSMTAAGKLVRHEGSDLEWGYRHVSLPASEIVLEVTFALEAAPKAAIAEAMERSLAKRRLAQPTHKRTTGALFLDPGEKSANHLLNQLGFRGQQVGGAQVCETHANFIVNTGDATAQQVVQLVTAMHDRAKEEADVELRAELKFLGFEA